MGQTKHMKEERLLVANRNVALVGSIALLALAFVARFYLHNESAAWIETWLALVIAALALLQGVRLGNHRDEKWT